MALCGDGAWKHTYCQHWVLYFVWIRHNVEQGHRIVSIQFLQTLNLNGKRGFKLMVTMTALETENGRVMWWLWNMCSALTQVSYLKLKKKKEKKKQFQMLENHKCPLILLLLLFCFCSSHYNNFSVWLVPIKRFIYIYIHTQTYVYRVIKACMLLITFTTQRWFFMFVKDRKLSSVSI